MNDYYYKDDDGEGRRSRNARLHISIVAIAAVATGALLVAASGPLGALWAQQAYAIPGVAEEGGEVIIDEAENGDGTTQAYAPPDPRPNPKWHWKVNPGNTLILGPDSEMCWERFNDAYWLINAHDTLPFMPWLVQNYLDHILCVDMSGTYPHAYGYAVVEASMFVAPRITYMQPTTTLAGMVVHEACHVYQFEKRQTHWGPEAEYQCTWWQVLTLKGIGGHPAEIERLENRMRLIVEEGYSWWD